MEGYEQSPSKLSLLYTPQSDTYMHVPPILEQDWDVGDGEGYTSSAILFGFSVIPLLFTTTIPITVATRRKPTPRRLARPAKPLLWPFCGWGICIIIAVYITLFHNECGNYRIVCDGHFFYPPDKFDSFLFIGYYHWTEFYMEKSFEVIIEAWGEIRTFFYELVSFILKSLHISFLKIEERKGIVVTALYRKRGKLSRTLSHSGMAAITALGVMLAPLIAQEFPGKSVDPWAISAAPSVLSASTDDPRIDTQVSSKVRDSVVDYTVQEGDTVASIAEKFNVTQDTIRWENGLTGDKIKIGQNLKVLPVAGVAHTVAKGDTVYSIAKKYDTEPQGIIDFPFNTFTNDETFELAIGQTVVVPEGVMPTLQATPRVRQITPSAGAVTASGIFVWPTQGTITQRFSWYHPGLDIANRSLPLVVAADSGRVTFSGWDSSGYGYMVLIDHGNGYITRYGHLSQIMVISGQTIGRGQALGKMGSTGRSTGPHLHFEIYQNGIRVNPLNFLR